MKKGKAVALAALMGAGVGSYMMYKVRGSKSMMNDAMNDAKKAAKDAASKMLNKLENMD